MTTAQLIPALIIPLVGWRIYTRARRNIGRQPFHVRRWKRSVVLFSAIVATMAWLATGSLAALGALAGGLLLGTTLAVVAFHLTRFETSAEGNFYTPNLVIGLGVTLLFVGRIAYRVITLLSLTPIERAATSGTSYYHNPLTLLTFGLTAGFYVAYNAALLLHAHKQV